MAKFKITWPDKSTEEVEQVECTTVEDYVSCRFGSSFDPKKVKVELVKEAAKKEAAKKEAAK